ncbi:MAG: malonyl-CoA decarboxylase family protein [Geminicoccaceae bacterium]
MAHISERINWMGDISAKGLDRSTGILVNYRYHPAHIEHRHEAYANDGAVVASTSVRRDDQIR